MIREQVCIVLELEAFELEDLREYRQALKRDFDPENAQSKLRAAIDEVVGDVRYSVVRTHTAVQ